MSEKEMVNAIRQIMARGNHAEVKQNKDGYVVYEVKKNKIAM